MPSFFPPNFGFADSTAILSTGPGFIPYQITGYSSENITNMYTHQHVSVQQIYMPFIVTYQSSGLVPLLFSFGTA